MAKVDIHKEAFDEGTKAKLELLRLYIREWLPVFILDKDHSYTQVEIYDFFAGEGKDSIDTPGSPLIILNELRGYCENLVQKKTRLTLLFNDFSKSKYQKLIDSKDNFLDKCSQNKRYGFCMNDSDLPNCPFKIKFENSDNKIKKLYSFELSLIEFLKTPRLNKELYVYSLEQGISISKTIEILKRLENESKLSVEGIDRQKGAFYLDYIPKKQIKIKSK